jgi:hypothetical protein
MTQQDLFDMDIPKMLNIIQRGKAWYNTPQFDGRTSGLPYVKDSRTSVAAAGKAVKKAEHDRRLLKSVLRQAGTRGLTDEEMQILTGLPGNTQRPRRGQLAAAGLICMADSGKYYPDGKAIPLTRKTKSGRDAVVWVKKIF